VRGTVIKATPDRIEIAWRGHTVEAVNSPAHPYLAPSGTAVAFFVRPEYVRLIRKDRGAPDPVHHMNLMSGTVVSQADFGTTWTLAIRLDEPGPARLRLNSTVVRVRHAGDAAQATEVEVSYARGGRLQSVRAANCVLACWSSVIPYLCPELPQDQREALAYAAKVPIVYTNVVLRDWTSFHALRVSQVHCPGSFHTSVNLDLPVRVGRYRPPRQPNEPIVVHMMRTPCLPGLPGREQHRAGRRELLGTTFETFERNVREQLARMLGAGGFDPARDVLALTVNRWPHGYAYQYNSLWDPFWIDGGPLPCVAARQPFGRIAIANADAAAYAYTDAAIDQAHRAVGELLRLTVAPATGARP